MTVSNDIDLSQDGMDFSYPPATFRSDVDVELVDMMGSEYSIVRRARVSVVGADGLEVDVPEDILKGGDAKLLSWLYRHKHGTPFEGVEFEWYFRVPIFVSRQIVKHRLSSINEESGRYSELRGEFYVDPDGAPIAQEGKTGDYKFVEAPPEVLAIFQQMERSTAEALWHNYNAALQLGIAKQDARKLLGVTGYTSMYFKCNLRSLLNFVSLRKDWGDDATHASKAQREIQLVTDKIVPILEEKFPNVWAEFVNSGYEAV